LFIKESVDLTALSDQLSKLVPLGLRVDAKEVRDKFGLSEPEEDAEILEAPQPQMQGFSRHSRHCGCQSSAHAKSAHKKDVVDTLTDQLEDVAGDALDGLMEPVRRLVAGAKSYEDVIEGLESMFPEMDDDTFAKTVGEALLATNLAGAASVKVRNG
jgi:phage gp29-like protein